MPVTPDSQNNGSNSELLKAINSLNRSLANVSKSLGGSSQSGGGHKVSSPGKKTEKRDSDREYERNKKLLDIQKKSISELSGDLIDLTKSLTKFSKSSNASAESFKKIFETQHMTAKTILDSNKMSRKFQEKFIDEMSKLMRDSKTLSSFKFRSASSGGRANELFKIQEKVHKVLASVNATKSKAGNKTLTELKSGDIKSIFKAMDENGLSPKKVGRRSFGKTLTGFDTEIAKTQNKIRREKSRAGGPNAQRLAALQGNLSHATEGRQKFLEDTVGSSVSELEKFNNTLVKSTVTNTAYSTVTDKTVDLIEEMGGAGIGFISAMAIAYNGLKEFANVTKEFAAQQSGGMSMNLMMDSFMSSFSSAGMMKYYKSMMFQASQIGIDQIRELYKDNKATFHMLGVYGDDALKVLGDFSQNLMMMGIHPRDTANFNNAISNYGKRLNQMAQLTGSTVEELASQDKAILSNTDTMNMMMRLDSQQRAQKANEILLEKDRISLLVGSNEEAAKFVQTLQKLNAESPEKRIENAMKIQQLAQMTGFSGAQSGRLGQIMMKREDQLTADDRQFKDDMMMEIGKRTKRMQGTGVANEMTIDRLIESQPEAIRNAIEAGADANLSKEQRGSIDKNSKNAKDTQERQQIGSTVSNLADFYTGLQNTMGNPIITLLKSILAAIGALALTMKGQQILGWAKKTGLSAFDKIKGFFGGGGGPAGGAGAVATEATTAAEGVTNAAADASKSVGKTAVEDVGKTTAKEAAKGIGKSVLKKIPLIGLIAGLGFGAQRAYGGDWLGAAGEVASGAAGMIPGIGTAASIGIDTALAGRDIYNAATPTGTQGVAINAPGQSPNNQQPTTINNVRQKKKATLDDLLDTMIADGNADQSKMDEIIFLLKRLINVSDPENNGINKALTKGKAHSEFDRLQSKKTLYATK